MAYVRLNTPVTTAMAVSITHIIMTEMFTSIMMAMATEPANISGALNSRRIDCWTIACTLFTSSPRRVIRLAVPRRSTSSKPMRISLSYTSRRRSAPSL